MHLFLSTNEQFYCTLLDTRAGILSLWLTQTTRVACPLHNPSHKGGAIVPCSTQATGVELFSPDPSYKNVHLHDPVHNHRLLSVVSLNSQGWGYYHLFHSTLKGEAIITCFTQPARVGLLSAAWLNPQGWGYRQLLHSIHKHAAIVVCLTQTTTVTCRPQTTKMGKMCLFYLVKHHSETQYFEK